MVRPKASAEQQKEQRTRLLRAAADLYSETGVASVTVRAVCEHAGVSTGTLYSYFDNLEALLQSLWVGAVERGNRQLAEIVAENPTPLARVRALLHAYVDFARSEPEVFRGAILFVRPSSAPPPDRQPVDDLPLFRLLRDAIAQGQLSGDFHLGDPDTMTHVLWAGVHGALALPINIDRYAVKSVDELAPAMIRTLTTSLTRI